MSNAFVVCQSAQGAVDVLLALQKQGTQSTAPKNTPKTSNNATGFKKNQKRRQDRQNRGKPFQPKRKNSRSFLVAPIVNEVMVIGDSIALRLARQQNVFAPKNMPLCYGGATFENLLSSLETCPDEIKLNRNVLLISGMNNALKHKEVSETLVREIVELLQAKNVTDVFIMTVPPICKDTSKNDSIVKINSTLKKIANPEKKIHIVDVYDLFVKDNKIDESLYEKYYYNGNQDLIHPNVNGLQLISEKMFEVVSSIMET